MRRPNNWHPQAVDDPGCELHAGRHPEWRRHQRRGSARAAAASPGRRSPSRWTRPSRSGATTLVPVTVIPGMASFAMFDDSDGLTVGWSRANRSGRRAAGPSAGVGAGPLVQGPRRRRRADPAGLQRAVRLEAELRRLPPLRAGGHQTERGTQEGLGAGGQARWAPIYASVPGVEETLARAEQLGGTRVCGPTAVEEHMQTGAFCTPGNGFGVYQRDAS